MCFNRHLFVSEFRTNHTQTGLVHNLTTMHISEWVELINMLHVETFMSMVAEMRERYQENERNSSPVLIIYTTLQVSTSPSKCMTSFETDLWGGYD